MKAGIWIAIILAIGVGAFFFYPKSAIELETNPIVVEAVNAISESWNGEALRARADPGLIKAMASQGQSAEDLLHIYSVLGKLKQQPDCKVHNTGSFMKGGERHNTISYECAAEYEKGPAMVAMTLSKSETATKWFIYYINIHSDAFAEIIE